MKSIFVVSTLLIISILFISCDTPYFPQTSKGCPSNTTIDYIDALKWNNIDYSTDFELQNTKLDRGNEIGQIGYTLSGNACMDYKMKNGDATYLPIGTKIYEAKGYKPSFRVIAGDKLYQVNRNPVAKTIRDLYDIQNKVATVSFESTIDGKFISDLSEKATKQFIEEYLALENIGFEEIYKKEKSLSDKGKLFLRIQLKDGTSFRITYWTKENAISPGAYGTDRLKEIILAQKPTNP